MRTYFKKRYNSFKFAFQGLVSAVRSEPHMRLHLLSAVGVAAAGFAFGITKTEWCLVVGCIGLVVTAEVLNTAIETVVNLVSPEFHPLAGRAKDLAAAAVLIAAIAAAIVGLIVFLPYVLSFAELYFGAETTV
ncbi:diacylglycerol kinase [Pontibacter actiniarum]|uniref:Diacylglycerol kinase n=1 Tax=Pontibacter actiniarum TaxID=323450 RepID=A0A1X9YVU9_9BACT|nr:diacylglycerol kinase family protein [Pontibacter actiniarum]ARS37025.1 diacylglycerol kinase [Pontibacter actiniarum]